MNFKKGEEVKGIVSKVENQGLYLTLENNEIGFLPKEAMNISKNKKLVDIFSEGFVISAKIVNKKPSYYTLTQKQIELKKTVSQENNKKVEKNIVEQNKTEKKNKKIAVANKKEKSVEKSEQVISNIEDKKSPTLKDLSKLKKFGNIKISVSKNKQTKQVINEKEIKEEEKKFIKVPNNFVKNIEELYKKSTKEVSEIKIRLKERGYLDEN